jgi:hypothetical protein
MSKRVQATLVAAVGCVLSALLGTGIANAGHSDGQEPTIPLTYHWGSVGPFNSHLPAK